MANSNGQNKVKEINMKRWILFLILSVFLIGCAKTKIVDDIDLVQVAAYDTEAEGKLKGTFAISAYKGGGKVKQKSIQHQARLVEVLARASEKSSGPLELEQLRVIIFNEKIIEKGMQEILETLNRNPSVGNAIYLAITNVKGNHY